MSRKLFDRITVPGPVEIQAAGDEPKIVGWAGLWYDGTPATEHDLGDIKDRWVQGAFTNVLASNPDVTAVFNHDDAFVLGRTSADTLTLEQDAKGLKYTIRPPATQAAQDLMKLIERGDIRGSSLMFRMKRPGGERIVRSHGQRVRELIEVAEIHHIGPVVWPALTASEATVQSRDEEDRRYARARAAVSLARHRLIRHGNLPR